MNLLILGLINALIVQLNPLTAISPVDGRYHNATKPVAPYFSEFGLIRYRVRIEAAYFNELSRTVPELKDVPASLTRKLDTLFDEFTLEDARLVKKIEQETNHDVKAVEYFLKQVLKSSRHEKYSEFIHFGLTSQDINNTAIPLLLKEFMETEYLPAIRGLRKNLSALAVKWKSIPMLAHTHGQPASPTRLGKEIAVFVERLDKQLLLLKTIPYSAKFGGATGNLNAHYVAYPKINWNRFADRFVKKLGLERSHPTTQIEHYDNLAALFDNLKRINTILIDLSRDVWTYISMNYFSQRIKENEVGSSAMPHKVNPIDFENAEGNLGYANGIFEFLSAKLPVSRLQRDLTDSTVLRNIGVPLAHSLLAFRSLEKGLSKIEVNKTSIKNDLNDNWAVVAEAIQTILRKEGYPNPYEALKKLTRRNEKITRERVLEYIESLEVGDAIKKSLRALSPSSYTGK